MRAAETEPRVSGRARVLERGALREVYPVLSKDCCGGVASELWVFEVQMCRMWRSCRSS